MYFSVISKRYIIYRLFNTIAIVFMSYDDMQGEHTNNISFKNTTKIFN